MSLMDLQRRRGDDCFGFHDRNLKYLRALCIAEKLGKWSVGMHAE